MFVINFCLDDFSWMNPNQTPWNHQYELSYHRAWHMIRTQRLTPHKYFQPQWQYCTLWFDLVIVVLVSVYPKSCISRYFTSVQRKDMAVSMSGRDLFIIHNIIATVEWKVVAFSSNNLSAPSVTSNNPLLVGVRNRLLSYYINCRKKKPQPFTQQ